ncbi:hypothetical protein ACVBEG_27375 [Pseudomonas sp. GG8]
MWTTYDIAVHRGHGIRTVRSKPSSMRPDAKELELVHRLDRDTYRPADESEERSMLRHCAWTLHSDDLIKRIWP